MARSGSGARRLGPELSVLVTFLLAAAVGLACSDGEGHAEKPVISHPDSQFESR